MTGYFGPIEKQTFDNNFFRKVLFTDGYWNVFKDITNKDILNNLIELNKFLNDVCISGVKRAKEDK